MDTSRQLRLVRAKTRKLEDVTRLFEERQARALELFVELEKDDGDRPAVLETLHAELEIQGRMARKVLLPLVIGVPDAKLGESSVRLISGRAALTRRLPRAVAEAGFLSRISQLCAHFEAHFEEEREQLLLPLRRLLSRPTLARAAARMHAIGARRAGSERAAVAISRAIPQIVETQPMIAVGSI
jgi:hypothetical protein